MCAVAQASPPYIEIDFGPFPDGGVVQAAVRFGDRTVRFGPILHAPSGARAGFHHYRMSDPGEMHTFLDVGLRRGALFSNGHHSYYNALPDGLNTALRASLAPCLGIPLL